MNLTDKILELTVLSQEIKFDHKDDNGPNAHNYTWLKYSLSKRKNILRETDLLRVCPDYSMEYSSGINNKYKHRQEGFEELEISCTKIILKEQTQGTNRFICVEETYEEIMSMLKSEDKFPSLIKNKKAA